MQTIFPVILENGIVVDNVNQIRVGATIISVNGEIRFGKTRGQNGHNDTVTNIVGFDGTELLKECPNCGFVKKSIDFGFAGRQMPIERRDQSHCTDCRRR